MSALSDFVQDIVCVDPTAQPNAPTQMPPTEPAPYAGEGPYDLQMPEIPRNPVPNIPEPPPGGFSKLPPGGTMAEGATEAGAETVAETGAEVVSEGAAETVGQGLLAAAAPVAVGIAAGAAAFLIGEDSAVPEDEEQRMLAESRSKQAEREAAEKAAQNKTIGN